MKRDDIDFIKVAVVMFFFFYIGILVGNIFNWLNIDITGFSLTDWAVTDLSIKLFMSLLAGVIYFGYLESDFFKFKEKSKELFKKSIHYFGVIIGIKFLVAILITIVTVAYGLEVPQSQNQSTIDSLAQAAPVLIVISSLIFAPFLEEVIFRMGLYKIIKQKHIFILVSGLIFGLMHIFPTNLPLAVAIMQSITYVSIGFALAYIYVKEQNIYLVMIVHALNNLFGLVLMLLFL